MKSLRVLICDDDQRRVSSWADRVRAAAAVDVDVVPMDVQKFADVIGALKQRVVTIKKDPTAVLGADEATEFDDADIVIIDSDLTPDSDVDPATMTDKVEEYLVAEVGEDVARLARLYSTAGTLAVVNEQWKHRVFDLRLTGFSDGIADLYVSEEDVDNEWIWGATAGSYRPWGLTRLVDHATSFESLCELDLNRRVVDGLELTDDLVAAIDVQQAEVLHVDPIADLTFRDVATAGELGLRPKEIVSETQLQRVAASVVQRWLSRYVLPSQNVIVDLPHLLQQCPWLADKQGGAANIDLSESSLFQEDPSYLPELSKWVARPVWSRAGALAGARTQSRRVTADDPVFCEDSSDFRPIAEARDFGSDLPGPYAQRFVAKLAGVDYVPRSRFNA